MFLKKQTLYILALSTLIISSCKPKTEHTIVQGYVKTYGSETTHEGIEIELNEEGVGVTLLDKTTTNSDGWYQLEGEFDVNKTHYLYLNNTPPKHYAINDEGYNYLQVKAGGVQNFNVNIWPVSWVKIHFKNIDPCDHNDIIGFYGNFGGSEQINGGGVDEYYHWRTAGNQEVVFIYTTNKCGVGTTYKDTVGYVPAFDTVDFEVFY
jgi:hypothetical protein